MKLVEGNLYFIKEFFFEYIDDSSLMKNHDNKPNRPLYFVFKEKEFLWLVPLSTKVDKYKRIYLNRIIKYGKCDTIIISKLFGKEIAILIQNAFPCIKYFIDHKYMTSKNSYISNSTKKQIYNNLKIMLKLKEKGVNLFYTNIDMILSKLEKIQKYQETLHHM